MLAFRGVSFRNKLIVSFMLVSLLPVILVQIISYYVSSSAMKNKIDVLVQANLLQTSKNMDTSIQAYDDIIKQIITNDEVVQLVNNINLSGANLEINKRQLINLLASYSYAKSAIRSVSIFTAGGSNISYDRQTGSPFDNLWSNVDDVRTLPIYYQAIDHSKTLIYEPEKIDNINNNEKYGFHMAHKLIDYNSLNLSGIGVVVITIYESVLAQAINLTEVSSETSAAIENRNYLVNKQGIIVSSPDKAAIGNPVLNVTTSSTIENEFENAKSGLIIYNLIDENELFNEMYVMRRLSIFIGVLAVFITVILIYYFSGRLSSSIRNILRGMRTAQQGILDVQVDSNQSKDEISHIAFGFNKLMQRINESMLETKEAVDKQKEAEIRALEAQINPHFLYNTLDSINWLAIEKEEHQISEMLKGLAKILRYSIKDSNKLVTIREELQWMDQYIYLQQYRFRSSFRCVTQCPEEAMSYPIPKLLIQPIIENAIIHGFEGRKQGGLLEITISITEYKYITVAITDNGTGMDTAALDSLQTDSKGIGLQNVMNRLEIYYANHAMFHVDSIKGEGTTVTIQIPNWNLREDVK
ncbi:hypothetical protein BBD42_28645 [Paenibacillus sp. BIHB 4019]|uniref:HAMP domain-containing protein n=2 Tax=Paenibacillus sp. BIHB 4019 TaxID=1870819 RepID=A0A1B2DQP7_9BACL|nr:hypothetical protein BBD42_28645 [Paenibacillus sp. BIHB 4019]